MPSISTWRFRIISSTGCKLNLFYRGTRVTLIIKRVVLSQVGETGERVE